MNVVRDVTDKKPPLSAALTPTTQDTFTFSRLTPEGKIIRGADVREALGIPRGDGQAVLMVNPHDDDCLLGAALTIQALTADGVRVYSAIVTDGRMGYITDELRENIVEVRRLETIAGYAKLGVPAADVFRFEYPDAQLHQHLGRRAATPGDLDERRGYTGLLNSLVHVMRQVRPAAVFINTAADTHPDHKLTAGDAAWAALLAPGAIWPELGAGFPRPAVWEYMVYSGFPEGPTLEVCASLQALDLKMEAVQAFVSQGDIGGLLSRLKENGPVEYFRRVEAMAADIGDFRKRFHRPQNDD